MAETNKTHYVQVKGPKDKDFRSLPATFRNKREAMRMADMLKGRMKGHDTRVVMQSTSTTTSEPVVVGQQGGPKKTESPTRIAPKSDKKNDVRVAKPSTKDILNSAKKDAPAAESKPAAKPAAKKPTAKATVAASKSMPPKKKTVRI